MGGSYWLSYLAHTHLLHSKARASLLFPAHHAACAAGLLGDLHRYDTSALVWRTLAPSGPAPPPRCAHGLAATGGWLFVFGGEGGSGAIPVDSWLGGGGDVHWRRAQG